MNKKLLFVACITTLLFAGCNKPHWYTTEQNVLLYTQLEKGNTCSWEGETLLALAHGEGTFTVYNKRGDIVESKKITAQKGVIDNFRYVPYGKDGFFLGDMKKNKPHGFGVLFDDTHIYIGRFKKGRFYGSDDDYLRGDVIVGLINGEDCTPEYYGGFKKGKPHGNCILYQNGIVQYEGNWKKGKRFGLGCEFFTDSIENGIYYVYDGAFAHDVQNGHGQLFKYQIITDSIVSQVCLSDSLFQQRDSSLVVNHKKPKVDVKCDTLKILLYQGEWKDGMRHGGGTEYNEHGITVYEGSWKKDMYDGKGLLYKEGKCIEGQFDKGRLEKEFKVSAIEQVKRTTNQFFGKKVFAEQEYSNEDSTVIPESSIAASKMEFIQSIMPELETFAKEKIDKRVDKRFGFWNIPRMSIQPILSKELPRADKAQKKFCKDLDPNTIEKWVNAKVDYYNSNHEDKLNYVDLGEIEKNQIVTFDVARKVFDREANEIGDFIKDILIGFIILQVLGFIIGFIIGFVMGDEAWGIIGIIDGALLVINFLICLGVSIFVNGPICNALESEISQMVLNNYMTYIYSQDIIAQMLGML